VRISKPIIEFIKREYGNIIPREDNEFGASGIGFCKKKIVLTRKLRKMGKTVVSFNGSMFLGKVLHKFLFPELIKNHPYGKAHGRKFWLRPRFEVDKIIPLEDENFFIHSHIDCDLPALDKIIEFKTTRSEREYREGDFLTDTYILQANAEAIQMGRSSWELWILHLNFNDVAKSMSIIVGNSDPELYEKYKMQCSFITDALENNISLIGPEAKFECYNCPEPVFFSCDNWTEKLKEISKIMEEPIKSQKNIPEEMQEIFNLLKKRKLVFYERGVGWEIFDLEVMKNEQ